MTINEIKNSCLVRLQRQKFFPSTFVVILLNQDFIFLGLEEEEKETDNNMPRVLLVRGAIACGYFAPFFPSFDWDPRVIQF